MIDTIRQASTTEFVLGAIFLVTAVMIVLQALVNRAVWSVYLILCFGSLITLAAVAR